ncbi:MAG: amine oxidase [Candidatus Pelagibacter sp.]|nr:amine oxidase [Candidatus Pelagibacter sp.]|tara:strand:- start:611 stop:1573 length:963 start_codon:yes stop_codon:yes gene_type:complete
MIDFCILGSGVSGSTIANLLSRKYKIQVFDKARGPGGRASNKRFKGNLSFDHGVQYISPETKEFKKFIATLHKKNVLKIWNGNHLDLTFQKKTMNKKFIGRNGNNAISKFLLKGIKQSYSSQIKKIIFKKNFWELKLAGGETHHARSIILTLPHPQLKKLAKRYLIKRLLKQKINMEPNITTMIAIKNQNQIPISSIRFNNEIVAWAANENSKKRFKSSFNLWTIQSSTNWAKKNINNYKKKKSVEDSLIANFLSLTGYEKNKIIFKKTHGWKYSYNFKGSSIKSYWDKKYRLGVCADWLVGSKVESAWISANDLNKKIK